MLLDFTIFSELKRAWLPRKYARIHDQSMVIDHTLIKRNFIFHSIFRISVFTEIGLQLQTRLLVPLNQKLKHMT